MGRGVRAPKPRVSADFRTAAEGQPAGADVSCALTDDAVGRAKARRWAAKGWIKLTWRRPRPLIHTPTCFVLANGFCDCGRKAEPPGLKVSHAWLTEKGVEAVARALEIEAAAAAQVSAGE